MSVKKIAFLATGDEIVNGDILNTNGQKMAQSLFDAGMHIGMHLVVSDNQPELEDAMHYLLKHHDALIITGGLGPTSDDRTRFALANVIDRELIFDDTCWKTIEERFKRYNIKDQPESNRHQAMFPKDSHIIPNPNGSAAGCWLEYKNKLIFTLPGPPSECLPMFDHNIKKALLEKKFATTIIHRKWLLFNVSEGKIADELDHYAEPFDVTTGYRICYPYLEFKAHAESETEMQRYVAVIQSRLDEIMLNKEGRPASDILKSFLADSNKLLSIQDHATKGLLQKTLTSIKTHDHLNFSNSQGDWHFDIFDLAEVWREEHAEKTKVTIKYKDYDRTFDIPFRGKRSVNFAVELICQEILNTIRL